jgi:hypothetical protein
MIPTEIMEQFREGFDDEPYLVAAIKKYLRTPEQKAIMAARDITIEDLLNGRVEGDQSIYDSIFKEWNATLGEKIFGF